MFEELQPLVPIVVDILKYAYFGAQAALLGYLKSEDLDGGIKALFTKAFWSRFKPVKALKTVIVGALLGAFTRGAIYLPISITSSADWIAFSVLFNSAIVLGVEALLKALVRRTPLMRIWNGIRDAVVLLLEKLLS